jgi:hypothetical protein
VEFRFAGTTDKRSPGDSDRSWLYGDAPAIVEGHPGRLAGGEFVRVKQEGCSIGVLQPSVFSAYNVVSHWIGRGLSSIPSADSLHTNLSSATFRLAESVDFVRGASAGFMK